MKKKVIPSLILLLVILLLCSACEPPAEEEIVAEEVEEIWNIALTPLKLVGENMFGEFGFGWDWDEGRPQGSEKGVSASGFGDSSFYSNVQGSAAQSDDDRDYTALRISPQGVFDMEDVTLADIKSISYRTKQKYIDYQLSWQLKIYTVNNHGDDRWYDKRFNTVRPEYGDTDWHLNSTDSNLIFEWIVIKNVKGSGSDVTTIDANRTLAEVNSIYGSESILFIDIIAGYASESPPIYSYLDGVEIHLFNGRNAIVNLEAD